MAHEDGDGHLRRHDGTFVSVGPAAQQTGAGVNRSDTVYSARNKVASVGLQNDTHEQTMAFHRAGGVVPPFRVPKWIWVIVAVVLVAFVWMAISVAVQLKAEGPLRRAQLLAWAAGDDAEALMGLSGAWQATFPGRQPSVTDMGVVSAVGEIQRRNETFFQGGREPDPNQLQPLLGTTFKCLTAGAAACIDAVAERQSELDARARSLSSARRPSAVAVPWDDSRSAVPTLLSSARRFLEFERIKAKARGTPTSEVNDDGAVAAILALCLNEVPRSKAMTPKGCADWAKARLSDGQASSKAYPVTRERLAKMDGWRWTAAAWSFNAAAKAE